ncbi:hypothetical protein BH10PSE1_BH10PSE1_05680 [soil metagenome]
MDVETADELFALQTDLMMVIGRLKRFATIVDPASVHPATEFAILDTILRNDCRTVPTIAKYRGVMRQSIQKVVNKMIEGGLLFYTENPSHKKSKRLELTAEALDIYSTSKSTIVEKYLPVEGGLREGDIEAAGRVIKLIANTWDPTA